VPEKEGEDNMDQSCEICSIP